MEQAHLTTSDGTQVMTINGQQLQVLQMGNTPHMLQGPNGQQIVVHAMSSAPAIQVQPTIIASQANKLIPDEPRN